MDVFVRYVLAISQNSVKNSVYSPFVLSQSPQRLPRVFCSLLIPWPSDPTGYTPKPECHISPGIAPIIIDWISCTSKTPSPTISQTQGWCALYPCHLPTPCDVVNTKQHIARGKTRPVVGAQNGDERLLNDPWKPPYLSFSVWAPPDNDGLRYWR